MIFPSLAVESVEQSEETAGFGTGGPCLLLRGPAEHSAQVGKVTAAAGRFAYLRTAQDPGVTCSSQTQEAEISFGMKNYRAEMEAHTQG